MNLTGLDIKLRIYLDTSILSAYYDERAPDRRAQTEDFWRRVAAFEACSSQLTREELAQTPDADRRKKLLQMLESLTLHRVTADMRELARRYVTTGVFTSIMLNDAVHVAAAVLTRQDILLSWNFKHLVNRIRRAKVNEVNVSLGLPTIEIIAPPEI
jgi:predicted nucleic acid-binding protein